MDFLNKSFAQIGELFRSMTPAARLITGLLLAAVAVSVVYLFNHQMSGPDAYLMNGEPISGNQIPAMEAAFSKANLNSYVVEGNRIRVPRGQQAAYMAAAVEAQALPASFGSYMRKAIDSGNVITTSKAQQIDRMNIARQDELAQIITHIGGIENAAVMFNEQVSTEGIGRKMIKTAAVAVKAHGNQPLEEDRVQPIRLLVAAATGGSPEKVVVTDLNTGQSYATESEGSAGAMADRYAVAKKMHERNYEKKIRNALSYIPGVVVTPEVEIDPETDYQSTETKIDAKTIPYMTRESTKTTSEESAPPAGRPGLVSQGGVSNQPATVAQATGSKSTLDTTDTETRNITPSTVIQRRKAALVPKKVTVTVSIPSSYLQKVWETSNPTPPGEEPKKADAKALAAIETDVTTKVVDCVKQLIPTSEQKDPTPRITVKTFQHLPSDPLPQPSTADQVVGWLGQNWSTAGMCVLGLSSLVMLRSMVRSVPASEPGAGAALSLQPAGPALASEESSIEDQLGEDAPAPARRKRRLKSGPTLRDDLVEMVREDPDSAANVLRSWIGAST